MTFYFLFFKPLYFIQNWYECTPKIVELCGWFLIFKTRKQAISKSILKGTYPQGLSVNTIQLGWSSVRSTNWTHVKFSQWRMAWNERSLICFSVCIGSFLSVLRGHQVERPNVERIWPKAKKTFSIVFSLPAGWLGAMAKVFATESNVFILVSHLFE